MALLSPFVPIIKYCDKGSVLNNIGVPKTLSAATYPYQAGDVADELFSSDGHETVK